jgi:hypothetical protein
MKMKKTLLSTAIAAGLGSSMIASAAINVSTNGIGEALLFPYYSAIDGNQTFITVANTTGDAKAVKVRFREGVGSRDVLDFTLYLSPFDHWSAVVFRDGDTVILRTEDESCTVPRIKGGPAPAAFSTTRISDLYTGDSKANRVSEGHIEILEMAVLGAGTIAPSITHTDSGVPLDCTAPLDWTAAVAQKTFGPGVTYAVEDNDNLTGANESSFLHTPSGGLYGHVAIFNPTDGTWFTYNGTALNGWAEGPLWFPQNASGKAGLSPYTMDLGLAFDEGVANESGLVEYFDLPDLSTPALPMPDNTGSYTGSQFANGVTPAVAQAFQGSGALVGATADYPFIGGPAAEAKRDAVTGALMRAGLVNDYITSTGLETEWVVTFPTRYLHVNFDLEVDGEVVEALGDVAAPFTMPENLVTGEACEVVGFKYYDREEGAVTDPGSVDFSPGGTTPDRFQLCYEVNVMAFNQSSGSGTGALKSSSVAKYVNLADGYENGWAELDFRGYALDDNEDTPDNVEGVVRGLPVLGFAAVSALGADVPRGATFGHHLVDFDNDEDATN